MGWIDKAKDFFTNAGKVVSGYVQNVVSDFKQEWNNQSNAGEDQYKKAHDEVKRTKTVVDGPAWFVKGVETLAKTRKIQEEESALWKEDTKRAVARTAINVPKNTGALFQLLAQGSRYLPQNIFLTDQERNRRLEAERKYSKKIISPMFDVTDYLTERNKDFLKAKPKTYDEKESFISRPGLLVNPEYMRMTIADGIPSIALFMSTGFIGKAGTIAPRVAQVFTSALLESPYASELDKLRSEGKDLTDASFKQWAWGAVNTGIVVALEQIGNQAAFDVDPTISTIKKSAFTAAQLQAQNTAKARIKKAMPYITKYFKDVAMRVTEESSTEFLQEVIPQLSHLFLLEGDLTPEQLDERLKEIAYGGLKGASAGFLAAMPFAAVSEYVESRAEYQGDIIFNESLGDDQELYLIKMTDNHLTGEDGYIRDGLLAGRVMDIQQKVERLGVTLDEDSSFMKAMVDQKYKTYAEFAQKARHELGRVLGENGFTIEGAAYVSEKIVGPDEFIVSKVEQTNINNIAVDQELTEDIEYDDEYTYEFDSARYSDGFLTGIADDVAASVVKEDIAQNELPKITDETQQAINDVLQEQIDNVQRMNTDQRFFVRDSIEPIEFEITFDRTQNGHDVVNKYEYIDGERALVDTMTLSQAQDVFGTTDRQEIASAFSEIENATISEEQTLFQEEGEPQRYDRAQAYATRIGTYQRLLNKTKNPLQKKLIKEKISNLERARRDAQNVKFADTFITDEQLREVIKMLPILKKVSLVELQNMIEMKDGYAYGSYAQAIVSYVKNPHETTIPHEAFHAFVDLVMTPSEKANAMAIIRRQYKTLGSDFAAEEKMAQLFAEFFITEIKPKTTLGRFFYRIKQMMLEFVGAVPELEKIFGRVISPFSTMRLRYINKMQEHFPDLQERMQSNALIETSKMFSDKFFARNEFQRSNLIGKLESKTISVSEPVRYLMLSVLTTGEFENAKVIKTDEFKQAVSDATMKMVQIDSDRFNTTGYLNVNQLNGLRTILNTDFIHGKQGHFSSEFDDVTEQKDIEIRKINKGVHLVDGQQQTVDRDMFAVIRKDVQTREQLEEVGVFALFDSEEDAQKYIDNFETRVTHKRGLFGHFGWSYAEDTKTFYLNEIQSDVMKNHLYKEYYRANKHLKQAAIDAVNKQHEGSISADKRILKRLDDFIVENLDGVKASKEDIIYSLVALKKKADKDIQSAISRQYYNSVKGITYSFELYNIPSLERNFDDIESGVENRQVSVLLNDIIEKIKNIDDTIRIDKEIYENRIKEEEQRKKEKIAAINDKYGKEGQYFFEKGKVSLSGFNVLLKAANHTLPNENISNTIINNERIFSLDLKFLFNLSKKKYPNAFSAYQQEHPGLSMDRLERMFFYSLNDSLLKNILLEALPKRIEELENRELTEAEMKEIALSEQFLSFKKDYYKVIIRQAIQRAAQEGAERIAFPSDYTLAKFEGWGMNNEDFDPDYDEQSDVEKDDAYVGMKFDYAGGDGIIIDTHDESFEAITSDSTIYEYNESDVEQEAADSVYDDVSYLGMVTDGKFDEEDLKSKLFDISKDDADVIAYAKEQAQEEANIEDVIADLIDQDDIDSLLRSEPFDKFDSDIKDYAYELALDNVDIGSWFADSGYNIKIIDGTVYRSESDIYERDLYYAGSEVTEEDYDPEIHLADEGHRMITNAYANFFRPYFIKNRGGAEFEEIDGFGYYVAPIRPNDIADVILFQKAEVIDGTELYAREIETPTINRKITNALADSPGGAYVFDAISAVAEGGKYPDRIPADLRRRELFIKMRKYILDDTMPSVTNAREIRLYDVLHNWMRERIGLTFVDFSSDVPVDTGVIIDIENVPDHANNKVAVSAQDIEREAAVRAFVYDELSYIKGNGTMTLQQAQEYAKKLANDAMVDTNGEITRREQQLIDASLRTLQANKSAVVKEREKIGDFYFQQLRAINQTYTPDTLAPKKYVAFYNKNKRKATDDELREMLDAVIKEVAIENEIDEALRYLELKNSENILDRLINIYLEDMKTGKSRIARYLDLVKTKTELESVAKQIEDNVKNSVQIKNLDADISIEENKQDERYRKAFKNLSEDERALYNISTQDFVTRMKDTYLVKEKIFKKEGKVRYKYRFVDGSFVDNIKAKGGEVVFSLAERAAQLNLESADELLTIITNNQKIIERMKFDRDAMYSQLLRTPQYIDVLRMINNKQNRMNIIAASYPNRTVFVRAVRQLELQAMAEVSERNAKHDINLQKKRLQAKLAKAIREGKQDLQAYKAQIKQLDDAAYNERIIRKAILASYQKTYKFITAKTIESIVGKYARRAGEQSSIMTMPRSRFNSILAKELNPIIDDAFQKFALAKQVSDYIEAKEIKNAENIKNAAKLKVKINKRWSMSPNELTANDLKSTDLIDIARYYDIITTLEPQSELLPVNILEKTLRNKDITNRDPNTFITMREFVQAVAKSHNMTEAQAWATLEWRRKKGYSAIDRLQGMSHVSDADPFTDFITDLMVDMDLSAQEEYHQYVTKYKSLYRAAKKSRYKSVLHKTMAETSTFLFGGDIPDTDMLVADYLAAYDRTKTYEENQDLTPEEHLDVQARLLSQMTEQEHKLAFWLREDALYNAGQFINKYEGVKLQQNYLTYKQKRFGDFVRKSNIFVAMWKYITANGLYMNPDSIFDKMSDHVQEHGNISTRHVFNYAKKRYAEEEGTTRLNEIILPYFSEFSRHKQFVLNLPNLAGLADMIMLDAETAKKENIKSFFKARHDQIRGIYKLALTPGKKPYRFVQGLSTTVNMFVLSFRVALQTVAPVSDIIALITDLLVNKGLVGGPIALTKGIVLSLRYGKVRLQKIFHGHDIEITNETMRNLDRITLSAHGIIGRTFMEDISSIDKSLPKKIADLGLSGYSLFFAELNRLHLYSLLSKEEIMKGEFNPGARAKYAKKINRGRYTHGILSESPIGSSVEGKATTKYLTWAMSFIMVEINFLRSLIRKGTDTVRSMQGKERKYAGIDNYQLYGDAIRILIGLLATQVAFRVLVDLIESGVLPDDPEEDDLKQQYMRLALREITGMQGGVMNVIARAHQFLTFGFAELTGLEQDVDELKFLRDVEDDRVTTFSDLYEAYGTGLVSLDFLMDNVIKTFAMYPDALIAKEEKSGLFSGYYLESKEDMKKGLTEAATRTMAKLFPLTAMTTVRNAIRTSEDARLTIPFTSTTFDVPFLSAKERDRDLSEQLFGHRFGLDDNQKEAYKQYKNIESYSTAKRMAYAKSLLNSKKKEDNEIGRQLSRMIANENFTTEQKKFITGINATYYKGEKTMFMTDGFRGYAMKDYLEDIKDPAERVGFLKNYIAGYVDTELHSPDVLKSYVYFRDNDITFTQKEEQFFTISSYDEKRAKAMISYFRETKATKKQAWQMILNYLEAGMVDKATDQALKHLMVEEGYK